MHCWYRFKQPASLNDKGVEIKEPYQLSKIINIIEGIIICI